MNRYNDDNREKPSWRDIDRKKDKSKHVSDDRRERGRVSEVRVKEAKRQYLDQVEQLFKGKKGNEEHDKLLRKLREGNKNSDFKDNLARYISEYDFPDDWEILMTIIDCGEPIHSKRAIEEVLKNITTQSQARREILLSRLKILRMTTDNRELSKYIKDVLSKF